MAAIAEDGDVDAAANGGTRDMVQEAPDMESGSIKGAAAVVCSYGRLAVDHRFTAGTAFTLNGGRMAARGSGHTVSASDRS